MTHNAVDKIKNYHENFLFEILINRSIRNKEKDRYSELSNLIYSEKGMSFRGFGTSDHHLEKTKKLLKKALALFIKKRLISKDKKLLLVELASTIEEATHSSEISKIVSHALDLTHEYKESIDSRNYN